MTTILTTADSVHAGTIGRNDPEDWKRGGYLPTLDGWRAIAIVLVLIAHSGAFYFSPIGPFPSVRLQAYATRCGAGVDIFFAISGLLICSRLLNESVNRGTIDLRRFYARRVFRILPPYFAYLLVIALCTAIGLLRVTPREWIASALFVRNYLPAVRIPDGGWYTGHFWSLAVEEHFYLLWPILVVRLGRRSLGVAFVLIFMLVIWRTMAFRFRLLQHLGEIPMHRTDLRMDALLWGCVAAFALSTHRTELTLRRKQSNIFWRVTFSIAIAAAIACFWRDNVLTMSLRPILLAYIILSTALSSSGAIAKILENSLLRWIGRLSYSIYIWQQLFFISENVASPPLHGMLRPVQCAVPLTMILAIASYYSLEKPLIAAGRRWFPDHSLSSSTSTPSVIPATSPTVSID